MTAKIISISNQNSKDIADSIKNGYSKITTIFDTIIIRSIKTEETTSIGESIHLHDPNGKVSDIYKNLSNEVNSHK